MRKETRRKLGVTKLLKFMAIAVALIIGVGLATILYKKMKPDIDMGTAAIVEAA